MATPEQRPSATFSVDNLVTSTNGLRNRRQRNRTTEPTAADGSSLTVAQEYIDTLTGSTQIAGPSIAPPSEDHMSLLVAMFPDHPRESISTALSSAHNNLSRAVEIMLSTPAPSGSSTQAT
ncbi:hypothetical protein DFQ29_004925 [Apophysomyces sp. BC1021]|nr:hypothetical protein DFQ29_004925 [Apophysomyces sp. BC1021]